MGPARVIGCGPAYVRWAEESRRGSGPRWGHTGATTHRETVSRRESPWAVLRQMVSAGQRRGSAIAPACARLARITRQGSSSLPTSTTRSRPLACSFAFSKHRLGTLGPCWVRDGLGVGILEPVSEPLQLVREQMPVTVQRHRRRGMAELRLDRLDTRALGDEQARAGMAKIVESQPMGKSHPGHRRLEDASDELLLPQRTTLRRGEHQIIGTMRPPGQVGSELVGQKPRQRHRAAGVGLGRPPYQPPIHLSRRLADLAPAAKKVQVPDTQRHQLPGTKPRVGGKAHQQLIARIDGGGQILDLPRGQEVHVPPDDAGQQHPGRRVAGDPAALHPSRQNLREHLMGVADPRRRQALLDQPGDPLAHGQRVDPGQHDPLEGRQDLVVQQLAVGPPRRWFEIGRGPKPALSPLPEQHSTQLRIDIGAAELGVLHADQELLGIHLAGEALGAFPARGITVARPPARPALTLLLAAQVLDVAHRYLRRSTATAPASTRWAATYSARSSGWKRT
jgi:hypothetical protein